MLLFHGIKVPTSLTIKLDYSFIAWLEEIKFSTSLWRFSRTAKKIRMFKLSNQNIEINQMRAYCRKTIRKITIFEKVFQE
jgi:hypothetical protein